MKQNKHLISLIFILNTFYSCQAQPNPNEKSTNSVICSDCNLKNPQGKKYGLWIEANGLREVYYKNNQRDGIYKVYNRKNGKLLCLGEYKNGNKSGKWYYFDESSRLLFTEENIKENKEFVRMRDDGIKVTPKYTSYIITYYSIGIIKEEGQVIYDEDIEIDYFKTGNWKYYDKEGKLTETKKEN